MKPASSPAALAASPRSSAGKTPRGSAGVAARTPLAEHPAQADERNERAADGVDDAAPERPRPGAHRREDATGVELHLQERRQALEVHVEHARPRLEIERVPFLLQLPVQDDLGLQERLELVGVVARSARRACRLPLWVGRWSIGPDGRGDHHVENATRKSAQLIALRGFGLSRTGATAAHGSRCRSSVYSAHFGSGYE